MTDKDNIGIRRLVRLEPSAKVISCYLDRLVRLVPGIDLGMDGMRLTQAIPEEPVHVEREILERVVVTHETMDIDEQELALFMLVVVRWGERLSRRSPWVSVICAIVPGAYQTVVGPMDARTRDIQRAMMVGKRCHIKKLCCNMKKEQSKKRKRMVAIFLGGTRCMVGLQHEEGRSAT